MAPEINEDFVGIHHDDGGSWSFIFPGEIERISEQIDRVEFVTRKLFAACEGFVRPTELEYSIQTYAGDGPIEGIRPEDDTMNVKFLSVEREAITDEDGLTADDIPFKSYGNQDEGVCGIGDIEVTKAQTLFTLSGYNGWLDRTNRQYVKPARFDEVYDRQAKRDPIEMRLDHGAIPAQSADTTSTFRIAIESPTDIWFAETPIGRANRRRLEAFFERITDQFNVVDTMVTSRKTNRILQDFFPA